MKKLKTIIIGCGNIAGGYDLNPYTLEPLTHAGAYTAHNGFEIVACCDPDYSKRAKFQKKWSIPLSTDYPEELLCHQLSVDVISICSPTKLHHKHLKTALELKPKLVFCEKPLVETTENIEYWIKTYKEKNIELVVNYTRRWSPDICKLKHDLMQKKWGNIRSISGVYNKGIMNNGSHFIDLIHYLVGSVKVIATSSDSYDFWDDDPSVAVLFESNDGTPITLNIAHAKDYALFEMQIVTELGVLHMTSGGLSWINRTIINSADFPGYKTLSAVSPKAGEYRKAMLAAVDNIYQNIEKGMSLHSTAETALQTQHICQQIRQHSYNKLFKTGTSS